MNEKAIQAASTAFAACGYDFPMPVDGDLDDEERGRYEALVAALTAAAPFMAAIDWQPIETAPKGERVQLYNELWEDTFGAVQIGVRMDDAADIKWMFDSGMDISPDTNWADDKLKPEDYEPTRWRPLPAEPQAQVAVTAGERTDG